MYKCVQVSACTVCVCSFSVYWCTYIHTVLAELKEKAVGIFDLDDHMIMKHLSSETHMPEGFDVTTKYVPLLFAFVSILCTNYTWPCCLTKCVC